MQIILNGNKLNYSLENEKTIGEVLGAVELACKEQNATVAEIKADGKEVLPQMLDNIFSMSVETDITLELFTIDGNYIRGCLVSLGNSFVNISEELEEVALKIQTGKDSEALETVKKFSTELRELYRCFNLFDIAGIPQDYKLGDKTIPEYQAEISPMLENLVSGFEQNDTVEVSDIAEYELSPLAKALGNSLLSFQSN